MRRFHVAADGRRALLCALGLGLGLAWAWRFIRRRRLRDNTLHVFHCGEQPAIAEELVEAATSQGLRATLHTLDAFESWVGKNATSMMAPPAFILIVTTDEELELSGAPAVSCLHFIARKSNPSDLLRRFRYAVVGLGDSNHLATSRASAGLDPATSGLSPRLVSWPLPSLSLPALTSPDQHSLLRRPFYLVGLGP